MRMTRGSAQDLIDRSISYTEIVEAEWTAGRAADLLDASDGSVENGDVVEFWGTDDCEDEEAAEWRVHLHR